MKDTGRQPVQNSNKKAGIKIIIADNNAIFRESLQLKIDKEHEMEVIGETENGTITLQQIQRLAPDIVITNLNIYDQKSSNLTQQISSRLPHIKVIALLSLFNKYYVPSTLKSAGTLGYLLKSCSFKDLKSAIHIVRKNEIYVAAELEELIPTIMQNNEQDLT